MRLTRRGFLGAAGGLVAGTALVGSGKRNPLNGARTASSAREDAIPFYGRHQAGITTPPQRCSSFAAFDVTTDRRQDLAGLLQRWTSVAANLCVGRTASPMRPSPDAVEPDSGAAIGLGPARLTVNFGFGPSLFGVGAADRFGLRDKWPMALVRLPRFDGDQLSAVGTGGDLTVHACADDPQVAFHAVRQLARTAGEDASIRWAQTGFNEAQAAGGTPRDLLGFKDGTVNPTTAAELDEFVWVGDGQDQEWMRDGTFLVVRRIRVQLDLWDAQTLATQERVIGRHKASGAPLGRRSELDSLDLDRRGPAGHLIIPPDAHVRLASPAENWAQMLLRRSYAYDNGASVPPAASGEADAQAALDAGLFFCAYQQNPRLAFIPIYTKLAGRDALRQFTTHTASAIAALPPGASGPGHWVGETLLG